MELSEVHRSRFKERQYDRSKQSPGPLSPSPSNARSARSRLLEPFSEPIQECAATFEGYEPDKGRKRSAHRLKDLKLKQLELSARQQYQHTKVRGAYVYLLDITERILVDKASEADRSNHQVASRRDEDYSELLRAQSDFRLQDRELRDMEKQYRSVLWACKIEEDRLLFELGLTSEPESVDPSTINKTEDLPLVTNPEPSVEETIITDLVLRPLSANSDDETGYVYVSGRGISQAVPHGTITSQSHLVDFADFTEGEIPFEDVTLLPDDLILQTDQTDLQQQSLIQAAKSWMSSQGSYTKFVYGSEAIKSDTTGAWSLWQLVALRWPILLLVGMWKWISEQAWWRLSDSPSDLTWDSVREIWFSLDSDSLHLTDDPSSTPVCHENDGWQMVDYAELRSPNKNYFAHNSNSQNTSDSGQSATNTALDESELPKEDLVHENKTSAPTSVRDTDKSPSRRILPADAADSIFDIPRPQAAGLSTASPLILGKTYAQIVAQGLDINSASKVHTARRASASDATSNKDKHLTYAHDSIWQEFVRFPTNDLHRRLDFFAHNRYLLTNGTYHKSLLDLLKDCILFLRDGRSDLNNQCMQALAIAVCFFELDPDRLMDLSSKFGNFNFSGYKLLQDATLHIHESIVMPSINHEETRSDVWLGNQLALAMRSYDARSLWDRTLATESSKEYEYDSDKEWPRDPDSFVTTPNMPYTMYDHSYQFHKQDQAFFVQGRVFRTQWQYDSISRNSFAGNRASKLTIVVDNLSTSILAIQTSDPRQIRNNKSEDVIATERLLYDVRQPALVQNERRWIKIGIDFAADEQLEHAEELVVTKLVALPTYLVGKNVGMVAQNDLAKLRDRKNASSRLDTERATMLASKLR